MKKTDYATLFPSTDQILRVLQNESQTFYRCPRGHQLPHRMVWGRCSPVHCCDTEEVRGTVATLEPHAAAMDLTLLGTERTVLDNPPSDPHEAELVKARSETTLGLLRAKAAFEAIRAFHPIPEVPAAPAGLSGKAYVERRLQDMTPLLVELRIFDALFSPPGARRDEAIAELLDRGGMAPRKKDVDDNPRPAVIMNFFGGKSDARSLPPFLKRAMGAGTNEQEVEAGGDGQGTDDPAEHGGSDGEGGDADSSS